MFPFFDFPQAFGAAEAISDRLCIASGQKISLEISAEDLLSCCDECGMGWVFSATKSVNPGRTVDNTCAFIFLWLQLFWWLPLHCLGVLGKKRTGDRRPVRLQNRWVWTEICLYSPSILKSELKLFARCVWQAADPIASLPVSITSTGLVLPVRVNRTLLSVSRCALMDTRHHIPRTNTLVQTSKMSTFLSCLFLYLHLMTYSSLCLHLQVSVHTASRPNRSRSWLSCTRTGLWRQLSLYMQIFCCTSRVRLVLNLFPHWLKLWNSTLNSRVPFYCRCVPACDRGDAGRSCHQDPRLGRGERDSLLAGCELLEHWLGR